MSQLLEGIYAILTLQNLLLLAGGVLIGMVVGVIPGVGPSAGLAILLPVTFGLDPTGAIVMLAAVYYGSMYGGTITSVLMNVPGEPSSVATTLDGFPMAKQGRGGVALVIAAVGSFAGATVGIIGLILAAPLAEAALGLGAREYFAIGVAGLALVVGLTGRSLTKGLISALIGLAIGLVGLDPVLGTPRFTGGVPALFDGIDLVAVIMGLFGLSEMLVGLENRITKRAKPELGRMVPTGEDWRRSAGPMARGSIIGFLIGLLPGSPGTTATFASYVLEKRLSRKHRDQFGKGAVEGVAGPETANNSLGIATMVPMFTLGIPASVTMAILMGAFVVHGLTPGPLLFRDHPDIAWAIIASLFVGNVILLVLNVPLVRVWLLILRIPYPVLFGIVLGLMMLGSYVVNGTALNILVLCVFGIVGYWLRKADIPLAPIALTMVLGPILETNLVRALLLSDGDVSTLWGSPFAAIFLTIGILTLALPFTLRMVRARAGAAPVAEVPPTEPPTVAATAGRGEDQPR